MKLGGLDLQNESVNERQERGDQEFIASKISCPVFVDIIGLVKRFVCRPGLLTRTVLDYVERGKYFGQTTGPK
jgi:hypothetical protein